MKESMQNGLAVLGRIVSSASQSQPCKTSGLHCERERIRSRHSSQNGSLPSFQHSAEQPTSELQALFAIADSHTPSCHGMGQGVLLVRFFQAQRN